MNNQSRRTSSMAVSLLRTLFGLFGDRRGNIAAMTALLIVPVVGALGMAIETGDWYMNQRAAQNAADSAALSAGLNAGTTGGTSCTTAPGDFDCEAQAAAAEFGFTAGSNNVTVSVNCYATAPTGSCTTGSTCPGGASQCYEVTVTKLVPISIMEIVGYQGDATIGSKKAVRISATSWARATQGSSVYCILALATSGDGISANGSPNFNSGGCSLFSDSSTDCNGHSLAEEVDAVDTADSGCVPKTGGIAKSSQASISDPWAKLATTTNIPDAATSCGGTTAAKFPGVTLTGTYNVSAAVQVYCGTVTLSGPVIFNSTASKGTEIIIYNGTLEFGGNSFTSTGNGVTIVFTGTTLTDTGMTDNTLGLPSGCTSSGKNACTTVDYFPQADGTLDISAPTSGTWSGIAVYVNPNLRDGTAPKKTAVSGDSIDGTFAGNNLTWEIQGLYYSPAATMSFSGSENKASNQLACFALVVDYFQTNGTGDIFSNPTAQCSQAGLSPPTGSGNTRAGLIG